MKRKYILVWWDNGKIKTYTTYSVEDVISTLEQDLNYDIENRELIDYQIKVVEVSEDEDEDEGYY